MHKKFSGAVETAQRVKFTLQTLRPEFIPRTHMKVEGESQLPPSVLPAPDPHTHTLSNDKLKKS